MLKTPYCEIRAPYNAVYATPATNVASNNPHTSLYPNRIFQYKVENTRVQARAHIRITTNNGKSIVRPAHMEAIRSPPARNTTENTMRPASDSCPTFFVSTDIRLVSPLAPADANAGTSTT